MLFSTRLAFSDSHDPPDGGRLWFRLASINMALLAEGECPNSNDKLKFVGHLRALKHPRNYRRDPLPVFGLRCELFATCSGNRVILRPAIVFR